MTITTEEAFNDFEYKEPSLPYFEVEVGLYDKDLDIDTDYDFDIGNHQHYYSNEAELSDVKGDVVTEFNTIVEDIIDNGMVYLEFLPIIDRLKRDFDNDEDIDNIDCFKIYVSIVSVDSDECDQTIFTKYIDIFKNNEDIITIPVKSANKTK